MNLIDPLHQHAAQKPHALAVITPDHRITWLQLDQLIWSTASRLHHDGLRQGDRVAITMLHPLVHMICALALTRLGVTQIAIPATESLDSRKELQRKLNLKFTIYDSKNLGENESNGIFLEKIYTKPIALTERHQIASDQDTPWMILQSSGTIGNPKFSLLSHVDTMQRCDQFSNVIPIQPNDVVWLPPRLDYFISKYTLIRRLREGVTICLPIGMPVSHELIDFLNLNKITLAIGIPSLVGQLIELGRSIPTLRFFGVTSSPVSEKLRKEFTEKINPNLYVIYATNETGSITMTTPEIGSQVIGSVGQPAPTIQVEVVDPEGNPQPNGMPGEIRVRAPGTIKCYLNSPEINTIHFKQDWFYPGDLGLLTEKNELVFLGRKDDMMIYDGINIYPAEIEHVLTDHPAVHEAAAFALSHEHFYDVPVVAVTLRSPITPNELVNYSKIQLGIKYPRKVFILKDFPRNAMGKILKRNLPQFILHPAEL